MKKAILIMMALILSVPFAAQAADQLVQFKAGEISMAVLESDGVTPLQSASIKMLSPEDNSVLSETVSDDLGKAVLALEEGRYLLNISDVTLAVMDVSADATITSCRVVMPAAAMLVAGQEAKDGKDGKKGGGASESGAAAAGGAGGAAVAGGSSWMLPVGIITGAAILIGGTWAYVDHQQPSKTIGRHEEPAPVPEEPRRHQNTPAPTPKPTPAPSAV